MCTFDDAHDFEEHTNKCLHTVFATKHKQRPTVNLHTRAKSTVPQVGSPPAATVGNAAVGGEEGSHDGSRKA